MRIVFIADEDQKYGAAKALLELVSHLTTQYKIKAIVLTCNRGLLNDKLDQLNIENYVVGHAPFLIGRGSTKLKKIIKKYFRTFFFLRYIVKNLLACIKAKKIVDFNNVDLIYTNVNRIDLGAILSKKFQLPHVWHIREFGDLDYDLISLKKDYIKYMNENTNVFLSISNAVKEAWIRKGINKQKIKMIYDGIDMNNIPPKIYKKSNFVNIIFAGSISETKQQIQLINALKQFPTDLRNSIHVDFFGTGTNKYLSYLKRIIDKNGLDNIISFKGYHDNVVKLLHNYDIGIVASRSEGFGRVTVEYMTAGLCVIASNTGANSELIQHKVTGLLYDYGDTDDLALKLRYAIQQNTGRREMGSNARNYALGHFSRERNADEIYEVYKEIIN